jgi:uncharacterized protein (UPF0332 family)
MDPRDFLDVAQNLLKDYQGEAAFRTSVSRSYYALHNYMSNFIVAEKFDLGKDKSRHKKIYQYLHNCGIEDIKDVATVLDDLLDERNRADYEMNRPCNKPSAELLFRKAELAYEIFKSHINNPTTKVHLKDGISNYLLSTSGQNRTAQ